MLAWRRTAIRRRVIVNLKTDKAVSGVLWAKRGALLVLKDAQLHESGRATAVDGELVIERSNVDFVQVLPPPATEG
jgi:small nuclear ribonucleoprotein (snRNP)-like protein